MFESEPSGVDGERKSLLSFGRPPVQAAPAARPSAPRPAPVDDALSRHRSARSRREAGANPMLSALASTTRPRAGDPPAAPPSAVPEPPPVPRATAPSPEKPASRPRLGGMVRGWFDGLAAKNPQIAASPAVEPAAAHPAPSPRHEPMHDVAAAKPEPYEIWRPLIDPMRVIGGIIDARWLIVAMTLLGAALGVAIALSTPKKYEAITELVFDPRALKLSDRDLTEQGLPSDATLALVENQVRILSSGTVLNGVVAKLNLDQDPEFNGTRKAFGIGGIIAELRAILSRSPAAGEDAGRRRTVAIESLSRALAIERGGKTFVITVGVSTESPEKSALIANTMAGVFLETYGTIQSQTAGRANDELTGRLEELRKGVEAAERKVAAFKAENDIVDPQGRPITDDELIKLNEQLSVARARTLELNARAASVRGADVDAVLGGTIPESINSNIVTELRSQYASLKQESDRLSVRLGPRHPERQAVEAQLAGAREQIAGELRRVAASLQVDLKRAVELEQQLASRLAQLKVKQGDLSDELVQLRELERDASTKRSIYESYLLRAKETGEQRGINTANMSVISEARAPLDPVGPSRSFIALTGAFLGFASGVGLGAMGGAWRALRDRRRDGRADDDAWSGGPDAPSDGPYSPSPPSAASSPAPGVFAHGPLAASRTRAPSPALAAAHNPAPSSSPENDAMYRTHPQHAAYAPQPAPAQGWTPGYADPAYAAPPMTAWPPQPAPAMPPAYAPPAPYYPQHPSAFAQPVAAYAPQPMQQPAYAWPPQPIVQQQPVAWQHLQPVAQPVPVYAQPPMQQQAQAYTQPPQYPQPYPQPQAYAPSGDPSSGAIAEIRASLAEFRDAVRDFSQTRQKRRYF